MQQAAKDMTHLLVLLDLQPHIAQVLTLEHLDHIRRQSLIAPVPLRHPILGLPLDHTPVKLILVPERRLLAELADAVLLGLVVASAVDVVFVLLEEAEAFAVGRLGTLLVIPSGEGV